MPDYKSIHDHLKEHPDLASGRAIAITWGIDDILELEGPDGRYPLSENEAIQILEDIKLNHNPEVGITWDTLQDAISSYLDANPREIIQGEVAVGTNWGGDEGSWYTIHVQLPAEPLEGKTHEEICNALERKAMEDLDARNEESAFVNLLNYETLPAEELQEDEEAA